MLMILGECNQNYTAAAALYAERYPQRRSFSRHVFRRLAARVRGTGRIYHEYGVRRTPRVVRNENIIIDVLAAIEMNPHMSCRQLARERGISASSVVRILHLYKLHPYHISLHQELTADDHHRRLEYCHWAQTKLQATPDFFSSYVLWTDEARFTSDGQVNIHNAHYWSVNNPHWIREVANQRRWSINVWAGIIGTQIIGPWVIDGSLSSEKFRNFLRDTLQPYLENVPLAIRQQMWLQLDGCPAHSAHICRQHLDQMFPERWIGRHSTIQFPPRSPDLTCMDFYFWGRIKDIVYQVRPVNAEDMQQRIDAAFSDIGNAELEAVHRTYGTRINRCIAANGGHFEHL